MQSRQKAVDHKLRFQKIYSFLLQNGHGTGEFMITFMQQGKGHSRIRANNLRKPVETLSCNAAAVSPHNAMN